MLLPLLAVVDDVTDEPTAESDELGLCGVPAVAAGLIRGPIAVICAVAAAEKIIAVKSIDNNVTATSVSEGVERVGLGGIA